MSLLPTNKVMITTALTGAGHGKEKNPALPITPEEIVQAAVECEKAGSAIVHIHARDKDGKATADINIFREIVDGLRSETNLIINLTTGGSRTIDREERLAVIPELKPDMASFSVGSTMTGKYDSKSGDWALDFTLAQSYKQIEQMARLFKENGVRPELEIYDVGMIQNVRMLDEMGLLEGPKFYSFVTGIPGQIIMGDVKTLLFLSELLPHDCYWQATGIGGRAHFQTAAAAILLGGSIRVGLEDNVFISKGKLADSNAALVKKAVRIADDLGKTPLNADEVRKLLNLKKVKQGASV